MSVPWINFLIAICLLLTIAIPAFGEITKEKRWKKRPTWRFWVMLLVSAATFLLGIYKDEVKDEENETQQNIKDSVSNAKMLYRDSVANAKTDSSVSKVVQSFAKGVGEYSLKMDSGFNGVLQLVRDSAKKVINQISEAEPYFGVCLNEYKSNVEYISFKRLEDNKFLNEISLCGRYATSKMIDIHRAYVIRNRSTYEILRIKERMLPKYSTMTDRQQIMLRKEIGIAPNASDTIYVYLYGTYKNSSLTRTFVVNELHSMNYNLNQSNGKKVVEEEEIKKILFDGDEDIRNFCIKNNIIP